MNDEAGSGSRGPKSRGPGSRGAGSRGTAPGGPGASGARPPGAGAPGGGAPGGGHRGLDDARRRERADYPALRAPHCGTLDELDARVPGCRACPRLVAWREEVAGEKRAAFRDWEYWGRPVPGFGPPDAALAVVGLAPAAHGANRTGRMFTGDASGDFLFPALHAVGLASRPTATHRDDGLELRGVRITSPVRCAPPQNRPTPAERDTCRPWLAAELELLRPTLRAVVVLGAFGWQALLPVLGDAGWQLPRPRPVFGHGAQVTLRAANDAATGDTPMAGAAGELRLIGCYHPSQRNTLTGRLTFPMVVDTFRLAAGLAGLGSPDSPGGSGREGGLSS